MLRLLPKWMLVAGLFALGSPLMAQIVTINASPDATTPNSVLGTSNYHVSENLYRNTELGNSTFTITPIGQLALFINTVGSPTTFGNVKISMKSEPATTNVLTASTVGAITGYTQVFNGSINASITGPTYITLSTPFVRLAGNNLLVLIERTDNLAHSGFAFVASLDNPTGTSTVTCRRYNGATAPTAASALTTSNFRPAIQLLPAAIPIDAQVRTLVNPRRITCYDAPQAVTVQLRNAGTSPIAAGAATVRVGLSGANTGSQTLNNAGSIAPGAIETLNFSLSFPLAGVTIDSALVTLAGDAQPQNDTLFGGVATATNFSVSQGAPILEDVEGSLPVISWIEVLNIENLWRVHETPPDYNNVDLPGSLPAQAGNNFFLFDSYSGANSTGLSSRLYSNCITLAGSGDPGCTGTLRFWMSHDNSFNADLDSMYVSVTTNKGVSWARIPGAAYGRFDAAADPATWREEVVSLAAYKGQTIQIGFEGVSKYGNVIGLDEISISSNCLLPITMADFSALRQGQTNLVKWTTAAESNNRGFELQRSADGNTFSALAQVPTKAPGGNSSGRLEYTYTDGKPLKTGNYYRLKQTDKDGQSAFSSVVYLRGEAVTGLQFTNLYPNPAGNRVFASIAAPRNTAITFLVSNAQGKILLRQVAAVSAGDNTIALAIGNLPAGSYMVKASCAEGCETSVQKFVKQ